MRYGREVPYLANEFEQYCFRGCGSDGVLMAIRVFVVIENHPVDTKQQIGGTVELGSVHRKWSEHQLDKTISKIGRDEAATEVR